MTSSYDQLSKIPGIQLIDAETGEGELHEVSLNQERVKSKIHKYTEPSFSSTIMYLARNLPSQYCEEEILTLFSAKQPPKGVTIYDMILPNGQALEVKSNRKKSFIIKKRQLGELPDDSMYAFVAYSTSKNKLPAKLLSDKRVKNPADYLKRNITIDSIYLIPKGDITFFYNSYRHIEEKEVIDKKTGMIRHIKRLSGKTIQELYDSNYGEHSKYSSGLEHKGGVIQVHSLGYEI